MNKIYIASDHAGYKAKNKLIAFITLELKIDVVDCGPHHSSRVDYPDFADNAVEHMLKDPESFGLLICGSGQGMAMRANKFKSIRAALCLNNKSATLARKHNHANVLCLGSRLRPMKKLKEITETFFTTGEDGGRHLQRVIKISKSTGDK